MARITVEDCQERVDNRFLLVQMAIKRVQQYREGYEALVDSRNKEVVTALREIAAGKVMPEDRSYYCPLNEVEEPDMAETPEALAEPLQEDEYQENVEESSEYIKS